jgi:hypothetical protein
VSDNLVLWAGKGNAGYASDNSFLSLHLWYRQFFFFLILFLCQKTKVRTDEKTNQNSAKELILNGNIFSNI